VGSNLTSLRKRTRYTTEITQVRIGTIAVQGINFIVGCLITPNVECNNRLNGLLKFVIN